MRFARDGMARSAGARCDCCLRHFSLWSFLVGLLSVVKAFNFQTEHIGLMSAYMTDRMDVVKVVRYARAEMRDLNTSPLMA